MRLERQPGRRCAAFRAALGCYTIKILLSFVGASGCFLVLAVFLATRFLSRTSAPQCRPPSREVLMSSSAPWSAPRSSISRTSKPCTRPPTATVDMSRPEVSAWNGQGATTDHHSLLVQGRFLSRETRHPCLSQEQPSPPRRPHCSSAPSIGGPGGLPMSWQTGGTFPI